MCRYFSVQFWRKETLHGDIPFLSCYVTEMILSSSYTKSEKLLENNVLHQTTLTHILATVLVVMNVITVKKCLKMLRPELQDI